MMQQENQDFDELVEVSDENSSTEIGTEAGNDEDTIVCEEEDEKTHTEQMCASEDDAPENTEDLKKEMRIGDVLDVLNELKEQNKELLAAVNEIRKEKTVYESYQQNLKDFKDTFEMFQKQLPQLIIQLRSDLKTGPGTDYRKIIEEAAENYKYLKKAIANDINKAIETWNKVRGGEKEYRKTERLLLLIVIMQIAITIILLSNYFLGA